MVGVGERWPRHLECQTGAPLAAEGARGQRIHALLPPEIKPGVLDAVSQALYNETWLELDYTNAKGERKQHRVMPLGLAQQGARLVLVVRYEGYDIERSLALNRAQKAADFGQPFPPVKDFNLAQYDDDGRFGFGSGKSIQIKFRIEKTSGIFLTESRLCKDQTVVDLGEKLEFTATVVESSRLVWWLGFGNGWRCWSRRGLGSGWWGKVREKSNGQFFRLISQGGKELCQLKKNIVLEFCVSTVYSSILTAKLAK